MSSITITKSVGAFEAKTHLSELLQQADQGDCIEITKRGKPIAVLLSPERLSRTDNKLDISSLCHRAKSRRQNRNLTLSEAMAWRKEGQKS